MKQWQVRVIPSRHGRKAKLDEIWDKVIASAGCNSDAGVHLILAHNRESDRKKFEKDAADWCRVVWLPDPVFRNYPKPMFDEEIHRLLKFEAIWRASIRPSVESPLLLPETAFSSAQPVRDMWRRARRVGEGRDEIDAVKGLIQRFRHRHHRSGMWLDERKLRFKRGADHGGRQLPPRRRTKLTFRLPDGFHFDVSGESGRAFSVQDRDGVATEFNRYANIDPHGFIRRGA